MREPQRLVRVDPDCRSGRTRALTSTCLVVGWSKEVGARPDQSARTPARTRDDRDVDLGDPGR